MKKQVFFATLVLIAVLFGVSSCKKSCPAPTYSLEGSWVGNYRLNLSNRDYFFAFHFKSDGNALVEGYSSANPSIATGTWTLVGDSVKLTYTYIGTSNTFSVEAKYSSTSNTMYGTWGSGTNTTGGGTVAMAKK